MTDRELLELAAKAAGVDVQFMALSGANIVTGSLAGCLWNPLEDDGDALRLAVKLGLQIDVKVRDRVYVGYGPSKAGSPQRVRENSEDFRGDPCAATRRAIVRAAAAIGGAA